MKVAEGKMAFITWDKGLMVGVPEIDSQHKQLVELTNELHDAMVAGKGKLVLEGILQKLLRYTVTHFETEERLMRRVNFPGIDKHEREHRELTRQVQEIEMAFKAGRVALTVQVSNLLKNWLSHHINGSDRAYVPLVNAATRA